MIDIDRIIARIDAFQASTGMSDTQLGLQVKRDGKLIKRLRNGASVRYQTLDLLERFIASREEPAP